MEMPERPGSACVPSRPLRVKCQGNGVDAFRHSARVTMMADRRSIRASLPFRTILAALMVTMLAACGSTSSPPAASKASTSIIGAAGGQVSMSGVVLNVPSGALAGPTPITVTEDPAGPPAGYVALTPLFRFSPDGIVFARPVTVTFTTIESMPSAHVYWSRPTGPDYDLLPTTWSGTTATAAVTHFSGGFVGSLAEDGGGFADAVASSDASAEDATASAEASAEDATTADEGAPEGGPPADGATAEEGGVGLDAEPAVDAGGTFVQGWITENPSPPTPSGSTVTVSVDETSSEPDGDGGCTAEARTGHQETTFPAIDLPYIFRYSFGGSPPSGCTGRHYVVVVTDFDSSGNILTSGTNACDTIFGASVDCDVTFPPPEEPSDAGSSPADAAPDATYDAGDLFNETIVFSGNVSGVAPAGVSFIAIELEAYVIPVSTGSLGPMCAGGIPAYVANTPSIAPSSTQFFVPGVATTYSFTVNFTPGRAACYADFKLNYYYANADGSALTPGAETAQGQDCGFIQQNLSTGAVSTNLSTSNRCGDF
jgi:hypothetical protein